MSFHLVQVNIAWMHAAIADPEMAGLSSRIVEINALAENCRGYVWRLPSGDINPKTLEPFEIDFPGFHRDRLFYNMSIWETLDDLRNYTFHTAHSELLNSRRQWVDSIAGASVALWWIPIGYRPGIAESASRLRRVREFGPTPQAFTLRKAFPPE